MRGSLAKLVLLLVSASISLVFLEVALAFFYPLPLAVHDPQVRYLDHPRRTFTLRPDQQSYSYAAPVRVDDRGLRRNGSDEGIAAAPGKRIVALGDSFTFGMGVEDDETWPAGLERRLVQARVFNLGTISYGVDQELDLLRERVRHLRPDLVVHGLYWNDFMGAAGTAGAESKTNTERASVLTEEGTFLWDPTPPRSALARLRAFVTTRSRAAYLVDNLMRATLRNAADPGAGTNAYERTYQDFVSGAEDPTDWSVLAAFYDELRMEGQRGGFDVVVVLFPVVGLVERGPEASAAYRSRVGQMLDAQGLEWVDGFDALERAGAGAEVFLPYNRHLDAAGYEIIAAALERPVKRRIDSGEESP